MELGGQISEFVVAIGTVAASGGALASILVGLGALASRVSRTQVAELAAIGALGAAAVSLVLLGLEEGGLL